MTKTGWGTERQRELIGRLFDTCQQTIRGCEPRCPASGAAVYLKSVVKLSSRVSKSPPDPVTTPVL